MNQIAARRRPYHDSGHVTSGPLPVLDLGEPLTLDVLPITVSHLGCFSTGFCLLEKSLDTTLPAFIHRDGFSDAPLKKKPGRLIKEFVPARKVASRDTFLNESLKLRGQNNVHTQVSPLLLPVSIVCPF
jgi:hypothetical protein